MSSPLWKGHLTIGELTIAARLLSGPDAWTPGLKQIHLGCGSPAGQLLYCKKENKPLDKDAIGKAADFDSRLIPLTPEQLASIAPTRSDTLPLGFISNLAIDPLFHESTYYIHPDGASEPEYAALLEVMRDQRLTAITKLVLQRERYLIIRPGVRGLVAHTLYFGSETRALGEFRTTPAPMARLSAIFTAVMANTVTFDPTTTEDAYPARLHQLVKALTETPRGAEAEAKKPVPRAKKAA